MHNHEIEAALHGRGWSPAYRDNCPPSLVPPRAVSGAKVLTQTSRLDGNTLYVVGIAKFGQYGYLSFVVASNPSDDYFEVQELCFSPRPEDFRRHFSAEDWDVVKIKPAEPSGHPNGIKKQ